MSRLEHAAEVAHDALGDVLAGGHVLASRPGLLRWLTHEAVCRDAGLFEADWLGGVSRGGRRRV
jgi:hypothetical protein